MTRDFNIPIAEILLSADRKGINKNNTDIVLHEDLLVFCRNKGAQRFRIMPFRSLYEANSSFWFQDKNWEFYFAKDALGKLNLKSIIDPALRSSDGKNIENLPQPTFEQSFGDDYVAIAAMTTPEKVKQLNRGKNKVNEIAAKKIRDRTIAVQTMLNTAKEAVIINHSALENVFDLGDVEAKRATQTLVHTTQEMAKSYSKLVSQNVFDNDLLNRLVEQSNGTIVKHMTRVYIKGTAFLAYYNKFVSNRMSVIKMRKTLNARYRQYYQYLLPHYSAEDIILERVFQKGMTPIPSDLFAKWIVGFLIHDIGKADAIEYHEGEDAYDRNIVMEHIKIGYNSIVNKTNYPKEACLITGYHHEYYGNPEGYGYFRDHLAHYRKSNPQAKLEYCMTFELNPILDCHALAYFPAKILEIVDVYDSVTDPNRVYRKALSSEEAIKMMREEFIVKHLKIDPILFELFTDFIRQK